MTSWKSNGALCGAMIRLGTGAASSSFARWPMEFRRRHSAALTPRRCNFCGRQASRTASDRSPREPDSAKARSCSGMARRNARGARAREGLRLARRNLSELERHRPRHHRGALERLGLLWPQAPHKRGSSQWLRRAAGEFSRLRCAIYTRKSSDEGLEQEFNSLHAQREACEAFIASQRHEGWKPKDTMTTVGFPEGITTALPYNSFLVILARARLTSWWSIRSTG